jgi:hypothetical protein
MQNDLNDRALAVSIRKPRGVWGRAVVPAMARDTWCVMRDLRLLTVFAVLRVGYGGPCPGFGGC